MGGLYGKSMTSPRQIPGSPSRLRAQHSKLTAMRYYGNVMTTTIWRLRILHLQQYSRRLNLFVFFCLLLIDDYLKSLFVKSICKVYSWHKVESIAAVLAMYQVLVATIWLEARWTVSGVVVMSCCCLSGENTTTAYPLIDRSVPPVDVSLLVMPLATTVTLSKEILFRLLTFLAVVTARLQCF